MQRTEFLLAFFMLVTGSINTISTKLADITKSRGVDGKERVFDHPFFQAVGMFFGESLCLMYFNYSLWRARRANAKGEAVSVPEPGKFPKYIFLLPAMCDMTGTSMMYIGLTLTHASVFQMLRGSVVIFTGLLSVFWLKRKLHVHHWIGMALVLVGAFVVGLSSLSDSSGSSSAKNPVLGNIFVIIAQVVAAVQMVVEEKFLTKYTVPALQAVGWEGVWGGMVLGTLMIPFYFIPAGSATCSHVSGGGSYSCLENAIDAVVQIGNSPVVAVSIAGNIISIAFFNFFGVSVTKAMSATHRMVLDSLRTMVIWGFSLAVGWQSFLYLQVIGFVILLYGTLVYNEILRLPFLPARDKSVEDPYLSTNLSEGDEVEVAAVASEEAPLLSRESIGEREEAIPRDLLLRSNRSLRYRYYNQLNVTLDQYRRRLSEIKP